MDAKAMLRDKHLKIPILNVYEHTLKKYSKYLKIKLKKNKKNDAIKNRQEKQIEKIYEEKQIFERNSY